MKKNRLYENLISVIEIEEDGFKLFILYDSKMDVIKNAYFYLNHIIRKQAYPTRRRKAISLVQLHSYLEQHNKDLDDMKYRDCILLENYLRDTPTDQNLKRAGATIQNYFSVFRDYIKCCGIQNHPLLEHCVYAKVSSVDGFFTTKQETKYNFQVKASRRKYEDVPKYISFQEYQDFINLAKSKNDKTAIILVTLMFIYGLRLGECLGLTVEDITKRNYHGTAVYTIILRNRKSDRDYQNAKTRMHIGPYDTYNNPDYVAEYLKDPYSTIVITKSMYEVILQYIDEVSTEAAECHYEHYMSSIADIVSEQDAVEQGIDENHYIFLNKYGKPLSDQAWNKREKVYFKELGLELDENVRSDNLNHRWRHGTAMFLLRDYIKQDGTRMTLDEVQKYLRHSSIKTTLRYINPTLTDQAMIKTELQNMIFEQAPELKAMVDEFVNSINNV